MKCRIKITKISTYEVNVVALNTEECKDYALRGFNLSDKSETITEELATLVALIE